jgi:hypothetical protein
MAADAEIRLPCVLSTGSVPLQRNLRQKEQPVEFWIKLPLPPEELRARGEEVPDRYPELQRRWDAHNKLWIWKVPTIEAIPDIEPAIELTSRHQAVRGPMPIPTG